MRVPLGWLRDYVEIELTPEALAEYQRALEAFQAQRTAAAAAGGDPAR